MSSFKKPTPKEEFERIHEYFPNLSSTGCTQSFCQSGRMVHTDEQKVGGERGCDHVEAEALDLLRQLRRDGVIDSDKGLQLREAVVRAEIRDSEGYWEPTVAEVEHGLRLSWKHARKCVMRSEFMSLR